MHLTAEAVARLEAVFEADATGGFQCPIPGHDGRARLVAPEGDWCLGCCTGAWRSLGQVRAAIAYGYELKLTEIESAVWWARLGWELDVLRPDRIPVPELEPGSSPISLKVREGFKLLVELREVQPVPFSARFAAAWCSVSKSAADRAIRELLDQHVIRVVGVHPPRLRLYAPCAGPPGGAQR